MDFAITTTREGGRALLTLRGSVDLATRDQLVEAGRAELDAEATASLVIDMAGVTFFDSSGIGALVTLAGLSENTGTVFSLRAPSAPVSRVLEISGLLRIWTIEVAT